MDQPSPESKYFPIIIQGTMDNMEVLCPFISVGDASNYMEQLGFVMGKLRVNIDLIIYQNGVKIGEIKTPVELLSTH
jgi:hypothetical protein